MTEPAIHNWGRWGEDDQLGTLNLQSPESVLRALQLVRRGKIYNLSVPLAEHGPQAPMFHKTWQTTSLYTSPDPGAVDFAGDVLTMVTQSGTHLCALSHCWTDDTLWNGVGHDKISSYGAEWAGVENISTFCGRGVMLDIAKFKGVEHLGLGEVVTVEDMEACAAAQGVAVEPGDVLLVRTGWHNVFENDRELWEQGCPGPDASCTAWLREKDVMAIGADNGAVEADVRADPFPTRLRLHLTTLRDLGVYMIATLDLEALAADEVYEFLFIAAPLRLPGATASPLTPLALA